MMSTLEDILFLVAPFQSVLDRYECKVVSKSMNQYYLANSMVDFKLLRDMYIDSLTNSCDEHDEFMEITDQTVDEYLFSLMRQMNTDQLFDAFMDIINITIEHNRYFDETLDVYKDMARWIQPRLSSDQLGIVKHTLVTYSWSPEGSYEDSYEDWIVDNSLHIRAFWLKFLQLGNCYTLAETHPYADTEHPRYPYSRGVKIVYYIEDMLTDYAKELLE